MSYNLFKNLGRAVHGTNIIEGNILEKMIYEKILEKKVYTQVTNGEPINLIENKSRKQHKVDIFCKDDKNKIINAYNSKSKSFNNTESGESILNEYLNYKKSIQRKFPEYTVSYSILKDEYDPDNSKFVKYHYLNQNGIPVYNTYNYLEEKYNITTKDIEELREFRVVNILRERIKKECITKEELINLCFSEDINNS